MNLTGKIVLLTGAAGGLGYQSAIELVQHGARVLAIDIRPDRGKQLQQEAADRGPGSLVYIDQDLRNVSGLRGTLEDLLNREGRVDVLINNAAIYPAKAFEDFDLEEYRRVQQVNVEAGIVCTQVLLPGMKARKCGRIISISSITFYGGWPNLYPYVASKAALIGLTRAWAREFGPYGVTVNCIACGAFQTDAEKIHPDPEAYNRFVLEHQSLKRRGRPQDVAHTLVYLASDYASFLTGQTLNLDGGWVMQ
jgi:3-oxoacyl-[acyl-carrier protein] reductase